MADSKPPRTPPPYGQRRLSSRSEFRSNPSGSGQIDYNFGDQRPAPYQRNHGESQSFQPSGHKPSKSSRNHPRATTPPPKPERQHVRPAQPTANVQKPTSIATACAPLIKVNELPDRFREIYDVLQNPRVPVDDGLRRPLAQNREVPRQARKFVRGQPTPFHQATIGESQRDMEYCCGAILKTHKYDYVSEFNLGMLKYEKDGMFHVEGLPDGDKIYPTNVKAYDDMLGAALMSPSAVPFIDSLLPADIDTDGHPYLDRVPCGQDTNACLPRITCYDFPDAKGNFLKQDERFGYYVHRQNGVMVHVTLLAGLQTSALVNDPYVMANFHHHFVDITDFADGQPLKSVFQEPEEIARQKQAAVEPVYDDIDTPPQPPIRTRASNVLPGKVGPATPPQAYLRLQSPPQPLYAEANHPSSIRLFTHLLNDLQLGPNRLPRRQQAIQVIRAIPTRGYDVERPNWELVSHAALSSVVYSRIYQAFEEREQNVLRSGVRRNTIALLHNMMNDLALIQDQITEIPEADHTYIGQQTLSHMIEAMGAEMQTLNKTLARHFTADEGLHAQARTIAENIPYSHEIIEGFPSLLYPRQVRRVVEQVDNSVNSVLHISNTTQLYEQRAQWNSHQVPRYTPQPHISIEPLPHQSGMRKLSRFLESAQGFFRKKVDTTTTKAKRHRDRSPASNRGSQRRDKRRRLGDASSDEEENVQDNDEDVVGEDEEENDPTQSRKTPTSSNNRSYKPYSTVAVKPVVLAKSISKPLSSKARGKQPVRDNSRRSLSSGSDDVILDRPY